MRLAARGACNFDYGVEKIDDSSLLAKVQRKARKVALKSLVLAAILTGFWLLP